MVKVAFHYKGETLTDNLTIDKFLDLLDKHRLGVMEITEAKINDKELNIEELTKILK